MNLHRKGSDIRAFFLYKNCMNFAILSLMSRNIIAIFFISKLFFLVSCGGNNPGSKEENIPTTNKEDIKQYEWFTDQVADLPEEFRFIIKGNFSGSGQEEILHEEILDIKTKKSLPKLYESNADKQRAVDKIRNNPAYTAIVPKKGSLPREEKLNDAPSMGFLYLRNEGDLNGDGKDEVAYVTDWADMSSKNFCKVISYNHGEWVSLAEFSIDETVLPAKPLYSSHSSKTSSEDKARHERIANFSLIKKLGNNKIQANTNKGMQQITVKSFVD